MIIWRLCRRQNADQALIGEGAQPRGGRWNFPGDPVVYTAGTLALAALEMLVHVDHELAPADLVSISIVVPEGMTIEQVSLSELPEHWRKTPAPAQIQKMGTVWIHSRASVLLRVPSALIPEEDNYLVNPVHPDFMRLEIGPPRLFAFDPRLFK